MGGIAHPLSEVIFPLKRNILLICKYHENYSVDILKQVNMRAGVITKQQAKYFNRLIAATALKNIYSDISSSSLARMAYNQRNNAQKLIIN